MKSEKHIQSNLSVYFCGRESCLPGHFYGPAVRPHYLLHVILDGKGIYQYKGTTFHLQKGDAFLIPPLEVTYYQADSIEPWSYAWVGFDGKIIQEILSQTAFGDAFIFKSPSSQTEHLLISRIELLLQTFLSAPGNSLEHTGCLLLLLSCMSRQEPKQDLSHASLYLAKAREYIENNYAYPIKISDIAHYIGIDRTYLYRLFMEKEQLSPKQYLLQHRLRMAVEMLCSSEYSITEIALSCGFQDASAFCNYFRQSTGSTPKHFRNAIREEQIHISRFEEQAPAPQPHSDGSKP